MSKERDWDDFYKAGPRARLMVGMVEVRSRYSVPLELATIHAALLEMPADARSRIDRIDCDSKAGGIYTVRLTWDATRDLTSPIMKYQDYESLWKRVAEVVGQAFGDALYKIDRGHGGITVERESAETLADIEGDWNEVA